MNYLQKFTILTMRETFGKEVATKVYDSFFQVGLTKAKQEVEDLKNLVLFKGGSKAPAGIVSFEDGRVWIDTGETKTIVLGKGLSPNEGCWREWDSDSRVEFSNFFSHFLDLSRDSQP